MQKEVKQETQDDNGTINVTLTESTAIQDKQANISDDSVKNELNTLDAKLPENDTKLQRVEVKMEAVVKQRQRHWCTNPH